MPPQQPGQPPQQNGVEPTMHNPLAVMHPGENTLFELKRHPIGIFIIYIMTGLLLAGLAFIVFSVIPNEATGPSRNNLIVVTSLGYLVFAALCVVFNLIATVIYWG